MVKEFVILIITLSCEWEYFMGLLNAFATFKISLFYLGIYETDGKLMDGNIWMYAYSINI